MGYKLRADPVKMAERSAACGQVPMFPVLKDLQVVGFTPGTVLPEDEFEWYGDPSSPPIWCSPLDDEGRAAYKVMLARKNDEREDKRRRLLAEVNRLEAELVADSDGGSPGPRTKKAEGTPAPADAAT